MRSPVSLQSQLPTASFVYNILPTASFALLILLELVVLNVSLIIFLIFRLIKLELYLIYYLVFRVCEGVLGLRLLVVRFSGNELYYIINIRKF